ncbi:MAG TPA: hypothetical protein DF383_02085 [Deltaproteobacteria bacterium]|nr:hypothetical protein [Deltaproteobacteria bacterium]
MADFMERQAPCPYFGLCGGCQLQHLSEATQLTEKQAWLESLLAGTVEAKLIRRILPSPRAWHYRRRIQLHVGPKGEVGFYAAKSRAVVDIESCSIAAEPLNARIPEVRRRAQAHLQAPKKPASLSYELTLLDDGEVEIREGEEERHFIQVNPEANRELIGVMKEALNRLQPRQVLELYAGNGNLSYALVQAGQEWLAVEANPRAVAAGKAAALAGAPPIEWHQGSAAKVGAALYRAGRSFDLVILDPPRGGAEDCLPLFRKWRPPAILYVSCHAPALKQDLRVLLQAAYAVEWVQPIDFFPQTRHVETLVSLKRV